MTDRGDILRVRLLDAACIGCGRPVTVWQGWGVVVTADRDGERHACGLDATDHPFDNQTDGSSVNACDILCDGRATARPSGAAVSCLEGLAP